MRRAVLATAGTVVGLAALLSYKSSGTVKPVSFGSGAGAPGTTTTVPAGSGTTGPSATTVPPGRTGTTAGPVASSPTTSTAPGATLAQATYAGQLVTYLYGDIEVDVTTKGGHVVNVSVPRNDAVDGRSQMINSYAVPILVQEAEKAQGMNFDAVSGATFTSDAFAQSFQSALTKAKL
jgi:uncharacterized protein with FMN-binding domain